MAKRSKTKLDDLKNERRVEAIDQPAIPYDEPINVKGCYADRSQQLTKLDEFDLGDAFYYHQLAAPGSPKEQSMEEYELKKGFIFVTSNPITGNPIMVDDPVGKKDEEYDAYNVYAATELSVTNMTDQFVNTLNSVLDKNPRILDSHIARNRLNADMYAAFHNMAVAAFTKLYVHANHMFMIAVRNSFERLAKEIGIESVTVVPSYCSLSCTFDSIESKISKLRLAIPNVFDLNLLLNYTDGYQYNNPRLDFRGSIYGATSLPIAEYTKSSYNVGVLCDLSSYNELDFTLMLAPVLPIMGQNFNLFNQLLVDFESRTSISNELRPIIVDYLLTSYNTVQAGLINAIENTVYVLWCEVIKYARHTDAFDEWD